MTSQEPKSTDGTPEDDILTPATPGAQALPLDDDAKEDFTEGD